MKELLQASIETNNMMFRLTGSTDYLKESQKSWALLKEVIKQDIKELEYQQYIDNLDTRVIAC